MPAQTHLTFCKRCEKLTEHYVNNCCVICMRITSKAIRDRNIQNGKCRNHKNRDLDPQSKGFCTECLEKRRQNNKKRKQKVEQGVCYEESCQQPIIKGKAECQFHTEKHNQRNAINNAIKSGIRYINGYDPDVLREFQNGIDPIYNEPLPLGRNTHRDHLHKTGWLRGLLPHKGNQLMGRIDVLAVETPSLKFKKETLDRLYETYTKPVIDRAIAYYKNPTYFQLLDSMKVRRPKVNEAYEEYIQQFPELAMKPPKDHRGRIYTL